MEKRKKNLLQKIQTTMKIEKEEQAPINLDDVEENTSKKKQTQ